jgi:hypothetical protein
MFDTCSFKPTNDGFPPSSGGGGGAVTSVFGRTGVVIAVAGDYTSSEITNSSSVTGTYVTDALNTLDTGKLSTTLTNGNIIVGNGSNVATPVAMSGDATISNTGALTISNQAVTFAKMQHISSQHLVGRHAAGSGDIQQISLGTGLSFSGANLQVTGFVSDTLTSANIIVGNNLGVATAVAMSGDTTISNTGAVTISNDAVTTAKILNSNVTYAKIQNVAATRLLGNSTGSPAAAEEITLGTNLSFTGTTLNAAGGGGYTYLNITLSQANTTYNKAALGGANYLFVQTNDANGRNLTIDNTGFVANDYLYISVSGVSPGAVNILINSEGFTQRGNTIFALYNGTNWVLSTLSGSHITGGSAQFTYSDGFNNRANGTFSSSSGTVIVGTGNYNQRYGSDIDTSTNSYVTAIGYSISSTGSNSILIGRSTSAGADSVSIGSQATGTGLNCVRVGRSVATGINTGVVAIGQGITTTNTDAVVIGRAASAGGTANVTIGGSATGTGANCVRIGNGVTTSSSTGVVAIGQGITNVAADAVIIGRTARADDIDCVAIGLSARAGGQANITLGASSNGTGADCIRVGYAIVSGTNTDLVILGNRPTIASSINLSSLLGNNVNLTKTRQFAKGAYAYPRHYGAESRRIDTNNSSTDATNPTRHSDNTAWNGSTNGTTLELLLFAQTGEYLTVQNNELLHFMVMVSAKKEGATDSRIMIMNGAAVATGGVASLIGSGTLATSDFNNSAGAAALTATLGVTSNRITMTVDSTNPASTGVWQWTANIINITRTRTA